MYSKTRERGNVSEAWTFDLGSNHLLQMHELEHQAVYPGSLGSRLDGHLHVSAIPGFLLRLLFFLDFLLPITFQTISHFGVAIGLLSLLSPFFRFGFVVLPALALLDRRVRLEG